MVHTSQFLLSMLLHSGKSFAYLAKAGFKLSDLKSISMEDLEHICLKDRVQDSSMLVRFFGKTNLLQGREGSICTLVGKTLLKFSDTQVLPSEALAELNPTHKLELAQGILFNCSSAIANSSGNATIHQANSKQLRDWAIEVLGELKPHALTVWLTQHLDTCGLGPRSEGGAVQVSNFEQGSILDIIKKVLSVSKEKLYSNAADNAIINKLIGMEPLVVKRVVRASPLDVQKFLKASLRLANDGCVFDVPASYSNMLSFESTQQAYRDKYPNMGKAEGWTEAVLDMVISRAQNSVTDSEEGLIDAYKDTSLGDLFSLTWLNAMLSCCAITDLEANMAKLTWIASRFPSLVYLLPLEFVKKHLYLFNLNGGMEHVDYYLESKYGVLLQQSKVFGLLTQEVSSVPAAIQAMCRFKAASWFSKGYRADYAVFVTEGKIASANPIFARLTKLVLYKNRAHLNVFSDFINDNGNKPCVFKAALPVVIEVLKLVRFNLAEFSFLPGYQQAVYLSEVWLGFICRKAGDTMAKIKQRAMEKAVTVGGWYAASAFLPEIVQWEVWLRLHKKGKGADVTVEELFTEAPYSGCKDIVAEASSRGLTPFRNINGGSIVRLLEILKRTDAPIDLLSHDCLGIINAVKLFGKDVAGIVRTVKACTPNCDTLTVEAIHDVFDFVVDARCKEPSNFLGLVLANPSKISRIMNRAYDYEQLAGVGKPKSYAEFNKILAGGYAEGLSKLTPVQESLALQCLEYGYSKEMFRVASSLITKAKKQNDLPDVSITAGKVKVSQLQPGDIRALFIGEESGCCQKLGGYGADAAIQSFCDSWTGVYVFESENGTLLAQAFAWLSKNGKTIMLDSVESRFKDNATISEVSLAIVKLAKVLKEKGYTLMCASTEYGMTSSVVTYLSDTFECSRTRTPASFKRLKYSDATDYCESWVIKV